MKKLLLTFSLLATVMMARALTATVYVQADEAPYLYGWFTVNGKETKINGAWPGKQMTETVTKTNQKGESITFWCQTFTIDATSFNIIFNNGKDGVDKEQTGNISDISSDRYFTYDGKHTYTDITEDFGVEIPDVDIQSIALLSDLNEWNGMAQLFTEVEHNVKYTYNLTLTEEEIEAIEGYYRFQLMVNSSAYLGWQTEGLTREDPNGWLDQDLAVGGGANIGLDVEMAGTNAFLFTVTFAGGKDIYQGWTLTVAEGTANINAIQVVNAAKAKPYNLSGQRVNNNYRGLVINNGKKYFK